MSAANTDKFRKVKRSFSTTLSAPGITDSGTDIPLPSVAVAELPTDTAITITIDRLNSDGEPTPQLREDITGVADPGNNRITNAVRTEGQAHSTGAVVEITWTEITWNDAVDALVLEHAQDGKHKPEKIDAHRYAVDAGSNDTYVITLSPVPAAYVTGMCVNFKPATANTGGATINVNSLGAKTIKKASSAGLIALDDGDLVPGVVYQLLYDGTDFQVVSPLGYRYSPATGWNDYSAVVPTRTVADDPVYTLSFAGVDLTSMLSEGMKVSWIQNSIRRYGYVCDEPSFSTNTTVKVITILNDANANYDVLDTSTYPITGFRFSTNSQPLGFPADRSKWQLLVIDTTERSQGSPSKLTWYNLGGVNIVLPIGSYEDFGYHGVPYCSVSATNIRVVMTLSTANNSETLFHYTDGFTIYSGGTGTGSPAGKSKPIKVTSKTTYYLNSLIDTGGTPGTLFNENADRPLIIFAKLAYH